MKREREMEGERERKRVRFYIHPNENNVKTEFIKITYSLCIRLSNSRRAARQTPSLYKVYI